MIKPIIFITLSCFSAILFAATNQSLPDELLYGGNPIDSLCFANLEKNLIDLKTCGIKQEKYTFKGTNKGMAEKGYIGYNWQDPSIPSGPQGYSYYQVFKAPNNQYWIYSVNNGGGSGEFTSLFLIKRTDPTTLMVQGIAGGDRCNGGIQDVSVKNNRLIFSVNLTPFDLMSLASKKPSHLKAYDDLAACAICCTAKAFYSVNGNLAPQFNHVELEKVTNPSELTDQGINQACFNKLFVAYTSINKTILNQEKLDKFAKEFTHNCL